MRVARFSMPNRGADFNKALQMVGEPPINKNNEERQFKPGNKLSLADNMSPYSNSKRLKALIKGWETSRRKRNGEKIMTASELKKKTHRKRLKLKVSIAKEASEIQEIARQHAASAMERLAQIVCSETSQDSVAVSAAATILDRAYGKASQTNINATVNADGKPNEITSKQLDERVTTALKRVEAITGGTPKAPPSAKRPADLRKLN